MSFVAVASIGAGVIGAGAGIAGAVMQSDAANAAANTQAGAARDAAEIQNQQFEQSRQDAEPWRQAGARALGQMESGDFQRDFTQEDFQQDPGYQFRYEEGQKALERSAAARGGLQGGQFAKALTNYGQGAASQEYQSAYNRFNSDRDRRFGRLSSLAGAGQNAGQNVANLGQSYASNMGNIGLGAAKVQGAAGMGGAQAMGQGMAGAANSIGQGVSGAVGFNQQQKWMDQWTQNQPKFGPGY